MTTINSSASSLAALLPLLCAVAGCFCQAYPLPGEAQCPTDARALYCTCGEEAVRRCPCGPDRQFYGLKPTDWRPWPAGWRCEEGRWGGESFGAPVLDQYGPTPEDLPPGQSTSAGDEEPNTLNAGEIELPGSPFPPLEDAPSATPPTAPAQRKPAPTRPAPRPAPMMPDTDKDSRYIDGRLPIATTAPRLMPAAGPAQNAAAFHTATAPAAAPQRPKNPRPNNPDLSDRVEDHLFNTLTL